MEYTKGPWRIREDSNKSGDSYYFIEAGQGYYSTQMNIGFVIQAFLSTQDAHLIAAAPDMYEALKELRSQIPQLWGDNVHGGGIMLALDASTAERIFEALAKAEGK